MPSPNPALEHPDRLAPEASLRRRLAFAGDSLLLFDGLFSRKPLSLAARIGDWALPRIPAHFARIACDLAECLRTRGRVPHIGNVEMSLLNAHKPVLQHPRYLSYWYDSAINSMVGMLIGVDLIRYKGKYYVIENNLGPSMYPRRRELYPSRFDPLVSGIVSIAELLGFASLVPVAYKWTAPYVGELIAAGREYGVSVSPSNCPFDQPGGASRMIALPKPLAAQTMYVIHSGLTTPVIRYVDDKWYTSRWLDNAIRNDLPAGSLLAMPSTYDSLTLPRVDHGARWPNLVIKLAGGARSCHVIAGRFDNAEEARNALGLTGTISIPRTLRSGYAKSLLFGRERVIYQEFIPPEIDRQGRAQAIRLHLLVSPLCTTFLSAHMRISHRRVPDRAPRGIIRQDDAFIWNDATYQSLSSDVESDLRHVAHDLGQAMQCAIERKFETRSHKNSADARGE